MLVLDMITAQLTPAAAAASLTKDLRLMLRGKDNRVNGFDRPINYPKQKWV
jgi:hypothetical protein